MTYLIFRAIQVNNFKKYVHCFVSDQHLYLRAIQYPIEKKANTEPTIIPITYVIGIVSGWLILNYVIRSNGIR